METVRLILGASASGQIRRRAATPSSSAVARTTRTTAPPILGLTLRATSAATSATGVAILPRAKLAVWVRGGIGERFVTRETDLVPAIAFLTLALGLGPTCRLPPLGLLPLRRPLRRLALAGRLLPLRQCCYRPANHSLLTGGQARSRRRNRVLTLLFSM